MHFLLSRKQTKTLDWEKKELTVDNMKKIITKAGNSPFMRTTKSSLVSITVKSGLFLLVLYFNFMRSSSYPKKKKKGLFDNTIMLVNIS